LPSSTIRSFQPLHAAPDPVAEPAALELYQRVFEDCPDYVTISRAADGRYLDVNPGFERFTGYSRAEVIGRTSLELGIWSYPEERQQLLQQLQRDGAIRNFACHLRLRSGEMRAAEMSGSVVQIRGEAALVAVVRDITERRRSEDELKAYREQLEQLVAHRTAALEQTHELLREREREARHCAHHDSLTGLPNRALLLDRLQQAITASPRNGCSLALLFIDLDDFKHINDSLGHQAGDEALRIVAARLTGCVRRSDTVARLGGDEFVIALSSAQAGEQAATIARKVMQALEQPIEVQGRSLRSGASIGIAVYPTDGDTPGALMQAADAAMYHAKSQGKNNHQFHSHELHAAAQRRYALDSELRGALEGGQLLLHYQPQVDMGSGRMIGVEALLRWQHPTLGMVPPLDFIPRAEQSGLIVPIGEWVLRESCRQLRHWRDEGQHELRLAVNVSPRQLWHPGFPDVVKRAVDDAGVPAAALDLEITESMLMQPTPESVATLEQLAGLGVRLHIDDFGTGYSSLAYLKSYPIHALKIDRSFVSQFTDSKAALAITSTIVAMARQLELEVIAEGVETTAQADTLIGMGCAMGQGYLFGRPAAGGTLDDRLRLQGPASRS